MSEYLADLSFSRGPMIWAVRHLTSYRYTVPVVFAPHVLRLNPRPETSRVLSRHLSIEPAPVAVEPFEDRFGNTCTRVTFATAAQDWLRIESRFEVEMTETALCLGDWPRLPWSAPVPDGWAAFRATEGVESSVIDFAHAVAAEASYAPLAFLDRLSNTLHERIERHLRMDGAAQRPADTLRTRRGACRDLTVLFLTACRVLGIAGRFVSGYQAQAETPDGRRHLHAWPEVLLPGAGWHGWDPTHGIRVGSGHVALCSAPEQAATMPVDGGFYFNGPEVSSTLGYDIRIRARPA